MSAVKKILDEIKKGASIEKLEKRFSWTSLNDKDIKELVALAQSQEDQRQSYIILVFLFRISRGKDPWLALEVLTMAAAHPMMTVIDRQRLLQTIRNRLDMLKESVGEASSNPEKLRMYLRGEANYYAINGNLLAETGYRREAIQNYRFAQDHYEQAGLHQLAETYKEKGLKLSEPDAPPIEIEAQSLDAESDLATEISGEDLRATQVPQDHPGAFPPAAESQPAPETEAEAPSKPNEMPPTSSGEILHPLPDVTLQNGQLKIATVEDIPGSDPRGLATQIQHLSEILAGIQMEIQLYLDRRSLLQQEVESLEKKRASLKSRIERLEKKALKADE